MSMFAIECDSESFRRREAEEFASREGLVVERLQQLVFPRDVAADTATVVGFQQRNVTGRLSSGPIRLKPSCLLVSCVFVEHFAHRLQQRPNTHPVLRFASITSSIPAVDVQVGVGEEGVPSDVHVEREPIHVDICESGDTDADKPLAQCGDGFVVMSNLLIPGPAFGSGFASKHDHQRSL